MSVSTADTKQFQKIAIAIDTGYFYLFHRKFHESREFLNRDFLAAVLTMCHLFTCMQIYVISKRRLILAFSNLVSSMLLVIIMRQPITGFKARKSPAL